MKTLRPWATPLTIGLFTLMSVTGLLMFFHLATWLGKTMHEWGGWIMVVAVVAHAALNWTSFKRYLSNGILGRSIIGLSLLALAGSFIPFSNQNNGPPPMLAFKAILRAPLTSVAPLTGLSIEQASAKLTQAGIAITNPAQSLEAATQGNEKLQGKAISILFAQK